MPNSQVEMDNFRKQVNNLFSNLLPKDGSGNLFDGYPTLQRAQKNSQKDSVLSYIDSIETLNELLMFLQAINLSNSIEKVTHDAKPDVLNESFDAAIDEIIGNANQYPLVFAENRFFYEENLSALNTFEKSFTEAFDRGRVSFQELRALVKEADLDALKSHVKPISLISNPPKSLKATKSIGGSAFVRVLIADTIALFEGGGNKIEVMRAHLNAGFFEANIGGGADMRTLGSFMGDLNMHERFFNAKKTSPENKKKLKFELDSAIDLLDKKYNECKDKADQRIIQNSSKFDDRLRDFFTCIDKAGAEKLFASSKNLLDAWKEVYTKIVGARKNQITAPIIVFNDLAQFVGTNDIISDTDSDDTKNKKLETLTTNFHINNPNIFHIESVSELRKFPAIPKATKYSSSTELSQIYELHLDRFIIRRNIMLVRAARRELKYYQQELNKIPPKIITPTIPAPLVPPESQTPRNVVPRAPPEKIDTVDLSGFLGTPIIGPADIDPIDPIKTALAPITPLLTTGTLVIGDVDLDLAKLISFFSEYPYPDLFDTTPNRDTYIEAFCDALVVAENQKHFVKTALADKGSLDKLRISFLEVTRKNIIVDPVTGKENQALLTKNPYFGTGLHLEDDGSGKIKIAGLLSPSDKRFKDAKGNDFDLKPGQFIANFGSPPDDVQNLQELINYLRDDNSTATFTVLDGNTGFYSVITCQKKVFKAEFQQNANGQVVGDIKGRVFDPGGVRKKNKGDEDHAVTDLDEINKEEKPAQAISRNIAGQLEVTVTVINEGIAEVKKADNSRAIDDGVGIGDVVSRIGVHTENASKLAISQTWIESKTSAQVAELMDKVPSDPNLQFNIARLWIEKNNNTATAEDIKKLAGGAFDDDTRISIVKSSKISKKDLMNEVWDGVGDTKSFKLKIFRELVEDKENITTFDEICRLIGGFDDDLKLGMIRILAETKTNTINKTVLGVVRITKLEPSWLEGDKKQISILNAANFTDENNLSRAVIFLINADKITSADVLIDVIKSKKSNSAILLKALSSWIIKNPTNQAQYVEKFMNLASYEHKATIACYWLGTEDGKKSDGDVVQGLMKVTGSGEGIKAQIACFALQNTAAGKEGKMAYVQGLMKEAGSDKARVKIACFALEHTTDGKEVVMSYVQGLMGEVDNEAKAQIASFALQETEKGKRGGKDYVQGLMGSVSDEAKTQIACSIMTNNTPFTTAEAAVGAVDLTNEDKIQISHSWLGTDTGKLVAASNLAKLMRTTTDNISKLTIAKPWVDDKGAEGFVQLMNQFQGNPELQLGLANMFFEKNTTLDEKQTETAVTELMSGTNDPAVKLSLAEPLIKAKGAAEVAAFMEKFPNDKEDKNFQFQIARLWLESPAGKTADVDAVSGLMNGIKGDDDADMELKLSLAAVWIKAKNRDPAEDNSLRNDLATKFSADPNLEASINSPELLFAVETKKNVAGLGPIVKKDARRGSVDTPPNVPSEGLKQPVEARRLSGPLIKKGLLGF
jgi:hypothetical protein